MATRPRIEALLLALAACLPVACSGNGNVDEQGGDGAPSSDGAPGSDGEGPDAAADVSDGGGEADASDAGGGDAGASDAAVTDADAAGCISEADGNGCVTTVQVNPGTYDVANGETFPLALPAGVAFIGDEAQKGNDSTAPVFIRGGGWTTGSTWVGVIPGSGSTIAGFEITAPFPADASSASPEGIVLGIYFGGGSAKIESNVVTANIYGVELDTSGADLGGGALSSAGLNTLSCNTSNDLWLSVSGVFAENDAWDHVPPTLVVDAGKPDIFSSSTPPTTTGATLASSPCP